MRRTTSSQPTRLARDTQLHRSARKGTSVPKSSPSLANRRRLAALFGEVLADRSAAERYDWYCSAAFREVAAALLGHETYVSERKAVEALRRRRGYAASVGLIGEVILASLLIAEGSKVEFPSSGTDLLVNGVGVEVKTSVFFADTPSSRPLLNLRRSQLLSDSLSSLMFVSVAVGRDSGWTRLALFSKDQLVSYVREQHPVQFGGRDSIVVTGPRRAGTDHAMESLFVTDFDEASA